MAPNNVNEYIKGAAVLEDLTPRRIVQELDRYIVGQQPAKRAIAIAIRNRLRRQKLSANIREEVIPKNILMIGPTGVGKTEIARRMARMVEAPFIKVEATKFTEVGYVGRDVESMVRDLVETAIRMVKQEKMDLVADKAKEAAETKLLELLVPTPRKESNSPFGILFGGGTELDNGEVDNGGYINRREQVQKQLELGLLEDHIIEIDIEDSGTPMFDMLVGTGAEDMGMNLQEVLGGLIPKKKRRRKVKVSEARRILTQDEAQKLIDNEEAIAEGVRRAEQSGIIFIDEVDKIAAKESGRGPDVSREGVQRDILPIVEGSTVMTKHGPVKTDHMLFIAAGAFHMSKPSDLIPELQGRFPIRVELQSLTRDDFKRILIEPENALIKQYKALLEVDGVTLEFSEDGIDELANIASQVNESTENIGARRLHTVVEKVLEDVSFEAPYGRCKNIVIDANFVKEKLGTLITDEDLSRYIL